MTGRIAVCALCFWVAAALPAHAAWASYISNELGLSFQAPGTLTAEKGVYRAAVGGTNDAIIYRFTENNIEYRASIVDFRARAEDGSVLMEEAAFILQSDRRVLMNDFGRVQTGRDAIYGRRMTFEQPDNRGRTSAATYFTKGRLYIMEATVLPANGDYGSPDTSRFLDSLSFIASFAEPGAKELPLPR